MNNKMIDCSELIERLDEKLNTFEYCRDKDISIPNIKYISYIPKKGLFKVKNLFAVIEMPNEIRDIEMAERLLTFLKGSLLSKYGDAFLWKELEIYFVIVCDGVLYEILKENEASVMQQASFSMNALIGVSIINRESCDNFAKSTWGLYFSGEQFKAINELVTQWCVDQKNGS